MLIRLRPKEKFVVDDNGLSMVETREKFIVKSAGAGDKCFVELNGSDMVETREKFTTNPTDIDEKFTLDQSLVELSDKFIVERPAEGLAVPSKLNSSDATHTSNALFKDK